MSPKTLRTIIAIFLFVHAIGHAQGVVAALGVIKSDTWHVRSCLCIRFPGNRLFIPGDRPAT